MREREDVENRLPRPRGRRPPPDGFGPRFGRVRIRFGDRYRETTWSDLAREMEIARERPWTWEIEGRFPGREKLAGFLQRLRRVRAENVDPTKLAKWIELGPDDKPPFSERPEDLDEPDDGSAYFQYRNRLRKAQRTGIEPAQLDDRADPRSSDVKASPQLHDQGTRDRFDAIARALEKKRLRAEALSHEEEQFAKLWPRLKQAIEAAEQVLNEAEGARTPNLRIDRTIINRPHATPCQPTWSWHINIDDAERPRLDPILLTHKGEVNGSRKNSEHVAHISSRDGGTLEEDGRGLQLLLGIARESRFPRNGRAHTRETRSVPRRTPSSWDRPGHAQPKSGGDLLLRLHAREARPIPA